MQIRRLRCSSPKDDTKGENSGSDNDSRSGESSTISDESYRKLYYLMSDLLEEFVPNFDPDDWDEDALEVFRCIAVAVNRLREGLPFRNTGTSCPFSLNLDWDDWDDDVAALLAQVEHAIEQARAAMEDGEPFPSADFVFTFDESIYHDDLVFFVRRIQVLLNGLKNGLGIKHQLKPGQRPIDALREFIQQRKAAQEAQQQDESSWQSLVVAARDSGQHGKAVELAEQAVREYPRSDWFWRILGGELTELDRLDEAEKALDTAHRLNPDAEWLWRHFAALHRKRKNLEGEIESLETLYILGVATCHDLNQLASPTATPTIETLRKRWSIIASLRLPSPKQPPG